MKFTVKIDECLDVLKKNLSEHLTELEDAKKVWTEDAKQALDKLRDAVDRKGLDASQMDLYQLFSQKPQDNRKNYSRYIGSLEAAKRSGEMTVILDEDDYDRMFNDNWEWRIASKGLNTAYSARRR